MFARTEAHMRAAREQRLVGVLGSFPTDGIFGILIVALFNPSEAVIVIMLLVLAVGLAANMFGGMAAEVAGVGWLAIAVCTGFLIFRNLMATVFDPVNADAATFSAFVNITFIATALNAIFSWLSAKR